LGALVATRKKDHQLGTSPGEVNTIPGPKMDPHLRHAFTNRPYVTRVSVLHPIDTRLNANPSESITKATKPF